MWQANFSFVASIAGSSALYDTTLSPFFLLRNSGQMDNKSADFPHLVCMEGINRLVCVEATDGSQFRGRLNTIDSYGNLHLDDVRCTAKDSSISIRESVFVKASMVRLIHLPAEVKLSPLLDWRSEALQQKVRKSLRVRARRVSSEKPKASRLKGTAKYEDKKIRQLRKA